MIDFSEGERTHGSIDPLRSVAAQARPALTRRFYATAGFERREDGFVVLLDGRIVKTPLKTALALPDARLAELIAQEWAAQGESIDPAAMHLTRLANTALCGVAQNMAATLDEVVKYAGSDLVCYRAAEPAALAALQAGAWNPVLDWARAALGAEFLLAEGIVFAAQPEAAIAAVRVALEASAGAGPHAPFRLAGLSLMTSLTGSTLLALQCAFGALAPQAAWQAAHVDEDFEIAQWGEDGEATLRRANRWRDFAAGAAMLGV